MVDSGAMRSVISEKYFKSLRIPYSAIRLPDSAEMVTANHSTMQQVGVIDLSISIQGSTMYYSFVILRDLEFKVILGLDFLNDSQASLDFSRQTLTLYDSLVIAALTKQTDQSDLVVLQRNTCTK